MTMRKTICTLWVIACVSFPLFASPYVERLFGFNIGREYVGFWQMVDTSTGTRVYFSLGGFLQQKIGTFPSPAYGKGIAYSLTGMVVLAAIGLGILWMKKAEPRKPHLD